MIFPFWDLELTVDDFANHESYSLIGNFTCSGGTGTLPSITGSLSPTYNDDNKYLWSGTFPVTMPPATSRFDGTYLTIGNCQNYLSRALQGFIQAIRLKRGIFNPQTSPMRIDRYPVPGYNG